jgi:predicted RNA-binding Zn-ribbon protein involved in translation (DUF1610 family)
MKMKSLLKEKIDEISIMRRSFPKLEASGLGSNFDDAQAHADKTFFKDLPSDDEPEMECPKCGGSSGKVTKNYRSGKSYSWEAKCDSCGHKWGDDSFDDPKDNSFDDPKADYIYDPIGNR